ncbi:MAG TPA: hypothetical protein VM513_24425 [Kofleriaceae bacterium]|nr:hypothetical protein [Kofleriaceae bacterium]
MPRPILPNKYWLLTRRCVQRAFLMRPDEAMNNAFLYCLFEAALRFDIRLLLAQMMSNHHHVVLYDPGDHVVEFYHRFHTNLAKCINALRGRWENAFASEPPCLVELVDADAVLDKLVYTATNPVKDGLVEQVHHWPGPRTVRALLDGRTLRARRPHHFFRDDGPMPEEVELAFTLPAELGDPPPLLTQLRDQIANVEAACAHDRRTRGRSVLGRRRVLQQSWRAAPTSHEPRRTLRPRVAARSKWARIEALQRNREFVREYRAAWTRWRGGLPAIFPQGTYALARLAYVKVREPTPQDAA